MTTLRVLLVDDEPVAREVVRAMLASLGHTVEVATTGLEALARCRDRALDLVLLDVQMPDVDGLAVASAVRQGAAGNPRVRIVALTGATREGDRDRCLAAGMDAYLAKPVRRDALAHTIDALFAAATEPAPAGVDVGALLEEVRGDMALLRRLIALFREQSASLLADGRRALDRGDRQALDGVAHALKSVVGHFSTGDAFEHARQVEALAHAGRLDDASDRWRTLEREIDDMRTALDGLAADALKDGGS